MANSEARPGGRSVPMSGLPTIRSELDHVSGSRVRRPSATHVAESRFQPAFVSQAISRDSCSFLAQASWSKRSPPGSTRTSEFASRTHATAHVGADRRRYPGDSRWRCSQCRMEC